MNLILRFTNIAIFYQDDSFGRDGLSGVRRALEKRGMELSAEGTFERNTKFVSSALRIIKRAEPQAVVMIGTYGPCAEFIKLAHKAGFHPTFVNVSFVGANALAKELGAAGEGVVVSQVVPFPWDTSLKVVADYQAAQEALDPSLSPGFVSLEGYLSGRLTAAALELAGPHPTRADLLRAINEVGRFEISGSVRRTEDAGRTTQGLPHRHSEGRLLQGRRPAVMEAGGWRGPPRPAAAAHQAASRPTSVNHPCGFACFCHKRIILPP